SGFKSEVTVFELLSHTSGIKAWLPFDELAGNLTDINDRKKAVTEIIDNSKRNEKTYLYSDLNYILLGFILEKVHGKNLDKIFDDFKKENCISSDITFNPVKKVPSTAFSKLRSGFPDGTVEDENCYFLGGMTGHAGLFASVADTVSYFKTLIGKEWFMKTGTELDFAGFDRPSGTDSNYGKNAQKNLIGHLGFTGTAVLIDPETENVSAFFTNSTHPSPEKPDRKERLKRCRQLFFDSCF
ncbi:MAG TPA: serine hydrolase domain-containing protein, partial [bacterium]|nr:serine hydrolase domain-containing protein [bacterium]